MVTKVNPLTENALPYGNNKLWVEPETVADYYAGTTATDNPYETESSNEASVSCD